MVVTRRTRKVVEEANQGANSRSRLDILGKDMNLHSRTGVTGKTHAKKFEAIVSAEIPKSRGTRKDPKLPIGVILQDPNLIRKKKFAKSMGIMIGILLAHELEKTLFHLIPLSCRIPMQSCLTFPHPWTPSLVSVGTQQRTNPKATDAQNSSDRKSVASPPNPALIDEVSISTSSNGLDLENNLFQSNKSLPGIPIPYSDEDMIMG